MWFACVGKRTFHGDDRLDAVALGEALAAEDELLVVLEAQRLDELARARRSSFSMQPVSATWPPPAG